MIKAIQAMPEGTKFIGSGKKVTRDEGVLSNPSNLEAK